MKSFLLTLCLFVGFIGYSQRKLPVYFDCCNKYWRMPKLNDSSHIEVIYEGKKCQMKIKLLSYLGKSSISLFQNDTLLVEGNYVNSLGILRGYYFVRTDDTIKNADIQLMDYYSPLRNGEWKYYYPNGEIKRIEIYDKGIFIKEM